MTNRLNAIALQATPEVSPTDLLLTLREWSQCSRPSNRDDYKSSTVKSSLNSSLRAEIRRETSSPTPDLLRGIWELAYQHSKKRSASTEEWRHVMAQVNALYDAICD
jgi:hypothetical protein